MSASTLRPPTLLPQPSHPPQDSNHHHLSVLPHERPLENCEKGSIRRRARNSRDCPSTEFARPRFLSLSRFLLLVGRSAASSETEHRVESLTAAYHCRQRHGTASSHQPRPRCITRTPLSIPPAALFDSTTPMVPPPSRPTHSQSRSGTFSPIPLPTQAGGLSSAGSPITGSPTSGHRFDNSIAVTQIYVLLNLLRDNNKDRVKWELQADQLKKVCAKLFDSYLLLLLQPEDSHSHWSCRRCSPTAASSRAV